MFLVKALNADVKHINASDESGIDIVRNKIRPFAATLSFNGKKIVVLDEFERMSADAQDALRSLMEMHSDHTRFILTTNYIDKVTEPIRSRCQEFVIRETPKEQIAQVLASILIKENIQSLVEDVVYLVNRFYPDIRKCINETQKSVDVKTKRLIINNLDVGNLSEFEDIVIKILANTKQVNKAIVEFRSAIADHQIMSFLPMYRAIYNNIESFNIPPSTKAMWYIIVADSLQQDINSPDKEITATQCIAKLLTI